MNETGGGVMDRGPEIIDADFKVIDEPTSTKESAPQDSGFIRPEVADNIAERSRENENLRINAFEQMRAAQQAEMEKRYKIDSANPYTSFKGRIKSFFSGEQRDLKLAENMATLTPEQQTKELKKAYGILSRESVRRAGKVIYKTAVSGGIGAGITALLGGVIGGPVFLGALAGGAMARAGVEVWRQMNPKEREARTKLVQARAELYSKATKIDADAATLINERQTATPERQAEIDKHLEDLRVYMFDLAHYDSFQTVAQTKAPGELTGLVEGMEKTRDLAEKKAGLEKKREMISDLAAAAGSFMGADSGLGNVIHTWIHGNPPEAHRILANLDTDKISHFIEKIKDGDLKNASPEFLKKLHESHGFVFEYNQQDLIKAFPTDLASRISSHGHDTVHDLTIGMLLKDGRVIHVLKGMNDTAFSHLLNGTDMNQSVVSQAMTYASEHWTEASLLAIPQLFFLANYLSELPKNISNRVSAKNTVSPASGSTGSASPQTPPTNSNPSPASNKGNATNSNPGPQPVPEKDKDTTGDPTIGDDIENEFTGKGPDKAKSESKETQKVEAGPVQLPENIDEYGSDYIFQFLAGLNNTYTDLPWENISADFGRTERRRFGKADFVGYVDQDGNRQVLYAYDDNKLNLEPKYGIRTIIGDKGGDKAEVIENNDSKRQLVTRKEILDFAIGMISAINEAATKANEGTAKGDNPVDEPPADKPKSDAPEATGSSKETERKPKAEREQAVAELDALATEIDKNPTDLKAKGIIYSREKDDKTGAQKIFMGVSDPKPGADGRFDVHAIRVISTEGNPPEVTSFRQVRDPAGNLYHESVGRKIEASEITEVTTKVRERLNMEPQAPEPEAGAPVPNATKNAGSSSASELRPPTTDNTVAEGQVMPGSGSDKKAQTASSEGLPTIDAEFTVKHEERVADDVKVLPERGTPMTEHIPDDLSNLRPGQKIRLQRPAEDEPMLVAQFARLAKATGQNGDVITVEVNSADASNIKFRIPKTDLPFMLLTSLVDRMIIRGATEDAGEPSRSPVEADQKPEAGIEELRGKTFTLENIINLMAEYPPDFDNSVTIDDFTSQTPLTIADVDGNAVTVRNSDGKELLFEDFRPLLPSVRTVATEASATGSTGTVKVPVTEIKPEPTTKLTAEEETYGLAGQIADSSTPPEPPVVAPNAATGTAETSTVIPINEPVPAPAPAAAETVVVSNDIAQEAEPKPKLSLFEQVTADLQASKDRLGQ